MAQALAQEGLYTEDRKQAREGQLYYPGHNGNSWYKKLQDGRHKLPDFKVKGQPKVIEIYGRYWHSQEFVEARNGQDYDFNPERMVEEYAKVGVDCKVYWESEIRDKSRLAEIVQEIKDWVAEPVKSEPVPA